MRSPSFRSSRKLLHRRQAVVLVTATLIAGLLLPATAAGQPGVIPIPDDPYERPRRVYVLPVIYVPADEGWRVADAADPSLDLDGNPISETAARRYHAARLNLSGHLQVAQEKYRQMLRRPGSPAVDRGTFALATWNEGLGAAAFSPTSGTPGAGEIQPWVYRSSKTTDELIQLPQADRHVFGELLDALGCHQQSCPFVLVTVIAAQVSAIPDETFKFHPPAGVSVNLGLQGGAGYFYVRIGVVTFSSAPTSNFGSTLLHELGHTFGLPHVWEVYDGSTAGPPEPFGAAEAAAYCVSPPIPPPLRKYSLNCSESIMSYNRANWTEGCAALGSTPLPGFPAAPPVEHCALPADTSVISTAVPGKLILEDLYQLGINRAVFPDLMVEESVDRGAREVFRRYRGPGGVRIPGHRTFRMSSQDSGAGSPHRIAGAMSNILAPPHAPFDDELMWRSAPQAPNSWAALRLSFPDSQQLAKLHLHSGHDGGANRPWKYQLERLERRTWTLCATGNTPFAHAILDVGSCAPAAEYRLRLVAGASGQVALRGLRIFAEAGGHLVERFPHRQPLATTSSGQTFGSKVANLVATDRLIDPSSAPFDGEHGWHSDQVGAGAWALVDITFPEDVLLGSVRVESGHTGGTHAVGKVQMGYRRANMTWQMVAEAQVDGDPTATVSLPATKARLWRFSFRAGGSGYVVLRGLRFYQPNGEEIYPARDGI